MNSKRERGPVSCVVLMALAAVAAAIATAMVCQRVTREGRPFDAFFDAADTTSSAAAARRSAVFDGNRPATAGTAQVPARTAPATGSAPLAGDAGGLTAAQRETLRLAYAGHPAAMQELPRAEDRVVFRNRWNRFLALAGTAGADGERERITLARQLDADLDRRVERKEITYGEAVNIKAAVLAVLDPAPDRRQQALAAWRKHVPLQLVGGEAGRAWTPQERTEEFERRKADAVAEWEAMPAEERDPEELRQYIQHLREAILEPP